MIKRLTAGLSLVVIGTAAGLLLLEVGLRILGISSPRFFTWDYDLGFALRPNAEGWWRMEGEDYIRINSDGLRDRAHAREKPPQTLRIAILGDSFSAAMQVPLEQTFWSILERELKECPVIDQQNVEVINFGVDKYGTTQELLTLQHTVWSYSPDIVILAFFTGNDIRDNSPALSNDPRPYFFIDENEELALDNSFRDLSVPPLGRKLAVRFGYWGLYHSRVLQMVNEHGRFFRPRLRELFGSENPPPDRVEGEEPNIANSIYQEPKDAVWTEAWQITEALIVLMREEVEQKGANFLVVTLSIGIQVHPDPAVRQHFRKAFGLQTLFYPDLRIKALEEREGVAVLNLAQPFQIYAERKNVFLHGFENSGFGGGHWNAAGHQLAGQMIASRLCQELNKE